MYKDKSICVVVPAHNEETQIGRVIETMPTFVDKIVIVDDCSDDRTIEVVRKYQKDQNENIILIQHETNQGVGGAIATGYKWAKDYDFDAAVVMAGDGQMDPKDLPDILDPVVEGHADYTKGNRLLTGEAYKRIPKIRYFGNAFLSMLTKISSGYWHIADSQSGYTAINKKALKMIDWDNMYKRYGQPNDLLVRLNIYDFKVKDVLVAPVYNIGEKSGIKIWQVVFTIGWLLTKLFFWRMKEKYVIRNFHPLVFFYALSFFLLSLSIPLTIRLFYIWMIRNDIPDINAMALIFTLISGLQTLFFGMWFDMESNKDLK